jgi:hypothetical protein
MSTRCDEQKALVVGGSPSIFSEKLRYSDPLFTNMKPPFRRK